YMLPYEAIQCIVMCHMTFQSTTDHIYNTPFTVSALLRCAILYLFYCIFTVPFLCLHMFRHTNTYHGVTTAYSIQYSTCCAGL
uniref:Uncharacterized protein n=1 Tax=Rhinolophus ferrumequinum TaxID=59479 RepID=A0A671FEC2_RHIFE